MASLYKNNGIWYVSTYVNGQGDYSPLNNVLDIMPFVGFDWRYRKQNGEVAKNILGQTKTKDQWSVLSLGAEHTLPWLVKFQGEVFSDGNMRFQLMRHDIPITPRIRFAFMINTDKVYMSDFKYIITINMGLSTNYDSDMGIGFGVNLNY